MDAMRFDVFKEIVTEEGIEYPYSPVESSGCETGMWMRNTWHRRHYKDITLVSNTAIYWKQINRGILNRFGNTVALWRGWRPIERGASMWGAVMPTEDVLTHAEKQHVLKPSQRLLIHDIPPHIPYCTKEGVRFLEKHAPNKTHPIVLQLKHYANNNKDGWRTLRHHYKESARITLNKILESKWLRERGELIITSDHGEMIGEGGIYGHSMNHKNNHILRTVPWMSVKQ